MRPSDEHSYRIRILACLGISMALVLLAVRLWPAARQPERPSGAFDARGLEVVALEEIQPTSHGQQPAPPPPAPPAPVEVPDEVVIAEELPDLDVPANVVAEPGETGSGDPGAPGPPGPPGPPGDGPAEAPAATEAAPEVGPRTVRFVEPEYTREARRRKIRAEVVVEVLVDEAGRVQEKRILERFLLGRTPAERQPVPEVGYGLEEAALAAAERWLFRPARQNGRPVPSYTTLTFTFGV